MRNVVPQRDGFALGVFLALTLVMTNPLVLHLATAVEDKRDALLNTWIIAWVGHSLLTDPLHLFNTNIFYPYPNTLAFSETLLPQGLMVLPINLASGNTILGYNSVLLFSFWLAAYAMYLFVFDLTRHRGAALAAGIIFAFNPYNLGNLAQVQLLSFGWLPLALLFLRRAIYRRPLAPRPLSLSARYSFLFAFFFSIQSLASIYYAFLSGIAVALYIAWSVAEEWFAARRNPLSLIPYFRHLLIQLACSLVVIAILVVPILLPYLQVQRDLRFQRKIEESEPFSASLKLYAEVSPQNVLYGALLAPHPPIMIGGYPLDNLFPGLAPVALGILGLVLARDRRKWFYFCLLTFAFILSLGPRLFLTPSLGTPITLPYRWLYDAISLLHALRAPVRFDALVMLALAVLAGMGARQLAIDNYQLPVKVRSLAVANFHTVMITALCLFISFEYLAIPAANAAVMPTGEAIPEYVRWLAQQPHGTMLELPMINSNPAQPLDLTAQYLSTYHWQNMPDGYSGFNPDKRGEIAYEMQFFPNERSIRLLQALDVRYLVVHRDRFPNAGTVRAAGSEVDLVRQFGNDYVYQVTSSPADPSGLVPGLYLPGPAAPGQSYDAYLIVQNKSPDSFAVKPTDTLQVQARWEDGPVQETSTTLPLVTSSVSITPVRLLAPSHTGTYHLSLDVSSSVIGRWRLDGNLDVRDTEPIRQVVLPAHVSVKPGLNPTYAPGDTIAVDLVWDSLNKINAYYSASVRVVDVNGNKVENQDREPATATMLWVPGSSVPDHFSLNLPPNLKPGLYSVQLIMYQAETGVDALLLDDAHIPQETVALGTFAVK